MNKDKIWVIGPNDEERIWREAVQADLKMFQTVIRDLIKMVLFVGAMALFSTVTIIIQWVF